MRLDLRSGICQGMSWQHLHLCGWKGVKSLSLSLSLSLIYIHLLQPCVEDPKRECQSLCRTPQKRQGQTSRLRTEPNPGQQPRLYRGGEGRGAEGGARGPSGGADIPKIPRPAPPPWCPHRRSAAPQPPPAPSPRPPPSPGRRPLCPGACDHTAPPAAPVPGRARSRDPGIPARVTARAADPGEPLRWSTLDWPLRRLQH